MLELSYYRLTFEAIQPIHSPGFQGSKWRSILMRALYQAVCFNKQARHCSECIAFNQCGYPYMFETPQTQGHDFLQRPHPYVVQTDRLAPCYYQVGDTVTLHLTLMGRAANFLPFMLYGLNQVCLGKTQDNKANLQLKQADILDGSKWQRIWQDDELLTTIKKPDLNELPPKHLHLRFYSPLRIVANNQLLFDFQLPALMDALIRRLRLIKQYYMQQTEQDGYDEAKQDVALTTEPQLTWYDTLRFSKRQQSKQPMGGLVGDVHLTVPDQTLRQALVVGQYLGIGKNTTMGLGQYQLIHNE